MNKPLNCKQNGEVNVEAMQMLNNNVDAIVKFLDSASTEVIKTKLSYKNMEIITIMVSCYNSKIPLRYKDYVVKYVEGREKKVSFVVMSQEQYHQRYTSSTEPIKTDYYNGRISPWGY